MDWEFKSHISEKKVEKKQLFFLIEIKEERIEKATQYNERYYDFTELLGPLKMK
jgi:hypothetical protein